ncbi:hypothetical protein [Sphingomonas aerolata]|uniref:hypothetical protein n=1 Tax=Sphingomonas aerolata TaxID=185951 RepID=UPI003A5C5C82
MATGNCLRTTVLLALNKYPAQTIFTFVDMGPRLITITHHNAIAGPYHRNGAAILDVQHAFARTPDEAHAIIKRHGATMLLLCPNAAESTNYKARSPNGFYAQMAKNEVPAWLTPLPSRQNPRCGSSRSTDTPVILTKVRIQSQAAPPPATLDPGSSPG